MIKEVLKILSRKGVVFNMNIEETIKKINQMNYRELLSYNRFAPLGDEIFCNKILSDCFFQNMKEKRLSDEYHTKISKEIGW